MRAAKGEWVDGTPVWQHREDSLTPRCRNGFRQREGLPEEEWALAGILLLSSFVQPSLKHCVLHPGKHLKKGGGRASCLWLSVSSEDAIIGRFDLFGPKLDESVNYLNL